MTFSSPSWSPAKSALKTAEEEPLAADGMTYTDPDSEGTLEQPTRLQLFAELGWEVAELLPRDLRRSASLLGRETSAQVVLEHRLRAAIAKLNPGVSPAAIDLAVAEVTKDRSVLSPSGRIRRSTSF